MNAYNASRSFAAPASVSRFDVRSPSRKVFAADPSNELRNPRGLVIAILMSAACWAGVGIAFLS